MNRLRSVSLVASLALSVSACLVHKPVTDPKPPVAVPPAYGESSANAPQQPLPELWWRQFGDPQLDALVDRALTGNFQLKAAWARIEQARAIARQAGAARWPQLNATGTVGRAQNRFNFGEAIGGGESITVTQNNYQASLGASYELDLWRKLDSRAKANALQARAARDDMEALAMSVSAEITEAWFDLLLQRELIDLLQEQIETNEVFLELVTLRFREGLGSSSLDVFQARQQVALARSQLALAVGQEQVASHRISVLVGQPPQQGIAGDVRELPALPPLPGTGVPADLLLRRPDVRAIRTRVEAADWQVAAAVADRLPSLNLTGAIFATGTNMGDFLSTPLYRIAADLLAPIFDGGRRAAEVDRTEAVVAELAANFALTLLQAMAEVENALVLEKAQVLHIEQVEQQVEMADSALGEARVRYREGLTDFLPVITELRSLQAAQQRLLTAQRQLIAYRVQLCRSLGGLWTRELKEPVPEPAPVPTPEAADNE